ncbi:MAG: anthranilate phosphoribosyltransferase [Gammaproteobacteria bacterium]
MDIQQAIKQAMARIDIPFDDMLDVMREIMAGDATPAQIAGLLVALNMKGETIDEVSAAATVMRELAKKVDVSVSPLMDTCGTGGDGSQTFNISTACAFVVAAAGGYVAKHGNRSVSSSSGSADVLEKLGVNIDLSVDGVKACINEIGIGFMFAPAHHSATRHAALPRKELGVRTLFNVLGPLTNPAMAPIQLMGIFNRHWQKIAIEVLRKLGTKRAFVVTADDGLDEISIGSGTHIASLMDGEISYFDVHPGDYGLETQDLALIKANDVDHSASIITQVLNSQPGPASDIVSLNAGAAIYLCGLCATMAEGVEIAKQTLASGAAKRKLQDLITFSRDFQSA